MPPPSTARLSFRRWRRDDLDLARALWGDREVTAKISAAPVDVVAWLLREIRSDAEHGFQYWPIFAGRAHVGCCGLRHHEPRIPELGVHICRAQWRRGYADEAATAAIAHAFGALHVEALFAGHHPANDASRRLLAKLGFRHTHDELYPPTGLMHPSYLLES